MALPTRPMVGLPSSPSFRYKQLNPAYQSDPRRILGQQLMQQGSSSAPVQTPLQGLGRLSSALVGAYLQKGAMDRQVSREEERTNNLTNMLPEGASDNQRQLMKMFPEMFAQSLMKGTTNTSLENVGSNLRALKTTTTGPFGNKNETLSNLTQITPAKPVKLVSAYNAINYNDKKTFPEGSAELIEATENGKFIIGNAPPPGPGYEWGPNNTLIVKKSGSEAFKRLSEYAKPVAENMNKYAASKSAYDQGASLFVQGTGSADVGLIYKFFGALEPTGKVTEGEATMTKLAASYGQQLSAKVKNAFKTGMFLPETRKELVNVMRNIIVVQQKDLKSIFNQDSFKDRFNELGITFKQLFPTYDITFEPISDLPTLSNSNNSNVGGDINIGNEGTGNQISTVIKNSKTNDLINSLTKN